MRPISGSFTEMRAALTGAVCMTAFAALGCGSDDPAPAASHEEQRVRAVVRHVMTADDPGACTRLMTSRFLEQTTFARGRAAVRNCRADADEIAAKKLVIDSVAVDGARAQTAVRPSGGTLPFERATFALRKDGGTWRFDRLTGGTLDRVAFGRVMREQSNRQGVPKDVSACAIDDLAHTSDDAIVRSFVEPDARVVAVPIAVCSIRHELTRGQLPPNLVNCILRGARRELTSGAIGRKLAQDPTNVGGLSRAAGEQLGAGLARDCVRRLGLSRA